MHSYSCPANLLRGLVFADGPETCMQDGLLNMLAAPHTQSAPDIALLAQCPAAAVGEFGGTVSSADCEQKNDKLQAAIPWADPSQRNVQQPAMPQSLHDVPTSALPAPGQQFCRFRQSTAAADFALWQTDGGQESSSGSVPVSHSQQCSNSLTTRQSSSSRTPAEDSCAKEFSLSDRNALLRQPQEQSIPDSAWYTDAASPTSQSSFASGKTSMAINHTLLNDLFPQPKASLHTPDTQPAFNQPGSLASRNASAQQSISPNSAPLFAGDIVPRDADAKLEQLLAIFCDLPKRVIANALQQAAYDVGLASHQLQVWLGWECHAKDDGDSPDAVATSAAAAAAESLPPEPEPPVQAQKCSLMGISQAVQVSRLDHNSPLHTLNCSTCHDIATRKTAAMCDHIGVICWH